MLRGLLIAGLAAAGLSLIACNNEDTDDDEMTGDDTSMGIINETCPMSGRPVDQNADTVTYNGRTVGFCCDNCDDRWTAKTDEEKDAYIAEQLHD
jgi:hypothetical protein